MYVPLVVALLVALSCAIPARVHAQAAAHRRSAVFYAQARSSSAARAERLLLQARRKLRQATRALPSDYQSLCERVQRRAASEGGESTSARRSQRALLHQSLLRRAYLDDAIARLDDAITRRPGDARSLYERARALSLWEEPVSAHECEVRTRVPEAIAAFEALQACDQTYEAAEVAQSLGLLRTRIHDFAGAARAYKRAIDLALDAREAETAEANLAEVTMLAGNPAGALTHYRRALSLAPSSRSYALLLLGAAVAHDRLGEHDTALAKAATALEAVGRSLSLLRSSDVFFEPRYERQQYEGLGHEALATLMPEARALSLESAAASYRAFVQAAGKDDPYRPTAQADLERVQAQLAAIDSASP